MAHKRTLKRGRSFEESVPASLLHQLEKRHDECIGGQCGVQTCISGSQPRESIVKDALDIIKNIQSDSLMEWNRNTHVHCRRCHSMKGLHNQQRLPRLVQEVDEKYAEQSGEDTPGIEIWASCMNNKWKRLRVPHKLKARDLEEIRLRSI